jgi:cell division inhibitor SulA
MQSEWTDPVAIKVHQWDKTWVETIIVSQVIITEFCNFQHHQTWLLVPVIIAQKWGLTTIWMLLLFPYSKSSKHFLSIFSVQTYKYIILIQLNISNTWFIMVKAYSIITYNFGMTLNKVKTVYPPVLSRHLILSSGDRGYLNIRVRKCNTSFQQQ